MGSESIVKGSLGKGFMTNTSGGSRLQPLEAKAHPADRLNQTVTSRLTKLAAEIPDVDVNDIASGVEMHVPHLLE